MNRRQLLVVEDEPLIAMLLEDWLTELDFDVIGPAPSVDAALILLAKSRPDGAILDVMLGKGTSYALADILVERAIPFVFASGHGKAGLEARFANFPSLSKPYNFDEVKRSVAIFGRKQSDITA